MTSLRLTPRDMDLLVALDRSPLTVEQLLYVSQTFSTPFASDRRVRGRLQLLRQAGWVRRWPYAFAGRGSAADYYKLSLAGYRLLYGPHASLPTKRYDREIGFAHQHHTRCLADFITHTVVATHRNRINLANFFRENTLRLPVDTEALFPDAAFELHRRSEQFNYLVELDNSTERVRSPKDADSWQRKIRLYDELQNRQRNTFRVLVVSTRSEQRMQNILAAACEFTTNPQRWLFLGVYLPHYLAADDPLTGPHFANHQGKMVSLLPPSTSTAATVRNRLAPLAAVC